MTRRSARLGEQRAELLARLFGSKVGSARIAAVFASDTRRAQRTAEPLAARLGVQVKTVPAGDVPGLLRQIRSQYRGRNVLVVGHSNTVPEIVRRLSRDGRVPPMGEDEYDTIYVVTVPTLGTTIRPQDDVLIYIKVLYNSRYNAVTSS